MLNADIQLDENIMGKSVTLTQPATYQIRVSGYLEADWSDWIEGLMVTAEWARGESPVTTLIGTFDQAALQGLLRRIYSLGLPLISVNYIQQD